MSKKNKKPSWSQDLSQGNKPRLGAGAYNFDSMPFKWRINSTYIDYDHPEYGWQKIPVEYLLGTIITRFHNLEGQTWAEIKFADNHCHPKPILDLNGNLQNRLRERNLDHLGDIFQISIGGRPRVFGYRERQIFYPIWWDEDHQIDPAEK